MGLMGLKGFSGVLKAHLSAKNFELFTKLSGGTYELEDLFSTELSVSGTGMGCLLWSCSLTIVLKDSNRVGNSIKRQ
jgi:hypothetical protein